ncbi:DUF7504 family protein [Natronosalvus rutilus]|uniref:Uncharacterized protein n=1 Tax=Natronosalvus rutilus TaxID=2953753 RepID=A0A9E7SV26_9EURY|nr:hypothetical protein [Natronosalvus rutilus]UTF52586.1 hypothetical protein NGM29_12410 [Natronosalvus rutilus]
MQTESGTGVSDGVTFAQALDRLKRNGSTVLVVGSSEQAAHEVACQRLLGTHTDSERHRLAVTARDATYRGHGCVCESTDARTRHIEHTVQPAQEPTIDMAGQPLATLGTDVIDAIREIESTEDGLDPAELRVCVDSIVPLLSEYDPEDVFKLLHITTTTVKSTTGMGHFHLPLARDHDAVNLFEPLFDAVVEVRRRDGRVEQRWHLRDYNVQSEWLEL